MEGLMYFIIGLIIGVAMSRMAINKGPKHKSGDRVGDKSVPYPASCKLHVWVYNKEDRLQCSACDGFPGEL